MQNISEIEDLVKIISKLPGLGPKSAKRIVLKLINNRDKLAKPMAKALTEVCKNIVRCNICGTLKPNLIECSYSSCEVVKKTRCLGRKTKRVATSDERNHFPHWNGEMEMERENRHGTLAGKISGDTREDHAKIDSRDPRPGKKIKHPNPEPKPTRVKTRVRVWMTC